MTRKRRYWEQVIRELGSIVAELRKTTPRSSLGRFWAFIQKALAPVGPIASLTAVIIASISLSMSVHSGEEMRSLLAQLNASVDETSLKIAALPASIGRFDSTVTSMAQSVAEQQRALRTTVDSLSGYVDAFATRLVNYREQLDKIVYASDRQLELLSERQKLLEQELGRKSDLRLLFNVADADSGQWRVTPEVENLGDAPSDWFTFFFNVPCSAGFAGEGYAVRIDDSTFVHVTFTLTQPIGFHTDPKLTMKVSPKNSIFIVRSPPKSRELRLDWTISFQHGTNHGTAILKLGKR